MPIAEPSILKHRGSNNSIDTSSYMAPRKILEQLEKHRQHEQKELQSQSASKRKLVIKALNDFNGIVRHGSKTFPPIALLVYSLVALSAVPVALFAIFALITSAILLCISFIGFGLVEGLCLMAGGSILVLALSGITLVTLVGFVLISMGYFAWLGSSVLIRKIIPNGISVEEQTNKALSLIQKQLQHVPFTLFSQSAK